MRTFIDIIQSYNLELEQTCLVAVSFGPDSMALLDRLRRFTPLRLHVVHLNHNIRQEAALEQKSLEEYCEKHCLPITVKVLPKMDLSSNVEDRLRNYRYQFFLQVYKELNAQAVFLGHQKDEQVETGIKRLFEGAGFSKISGMRLDTHSFHMRLLRPQLCESKEDVLQYLDLQKIAYAIDKTNFDSHYLRGRMRADLIPLLNASFGKNVTNNIFDLMEMSHQLADYLDKKIDSVWNMQMQGPYGVFFPAEGLSLLEDLELDHLLCRVNVTNRNTRKRIIAYYKENKFGTKVFDKLTRCFVEKQGLFFLTSDLKPTKLSCEPSCKKGWLSFWKGDIGYFSPKNRQRWIDPKDKKLENWNHVAKKYSQHNIPIFLRSLVYVLEDQGKVIYEFLTL